MNVSRISSWTLAVSTGLILALVGTSAGQGPGEDLDLGSKPSAAWLDKDKPVGERLKGLDQERREKLQTAVKAYRLAKTDEERRAAERITPHHVAYLRAFLAIEQEVPNTAEGLQALSSGLEVLNRYAMNGHPYGALRDEEYAKRQRNFVDSGEVIRKMRPYAICPWVMSCCNVIASRPSPESEPFLREILLKNTDRQNRAYACFYLGILLCRYSDLVHSIVSGEMPLENYERRLSKEFINSLVLRGADDLEKEGIKMLERVKTEFYTVEQDRGQNRTVNPIGPQAISYIETRKTIVESRNP